MTIHEIDTHKKFICKPKTEELARRNWLGFKDARAIKENDEHVFVFAPRSNRTGRRFTIEQFEQIFDYTIKDEKEETAEWHKRLKNASDKLAASGLWENVKTVFDNLQKITLDEQREIYNIYWQYDRNRSREENEQFKTAEMRKLSAKYPYMFYRNDDGNLLFNTEYIDGYTNVRTKSMYFGKYYNDDAKRRIAEAMANGQKIRETGYSSYDVSFEYDPDKKRAWYSEEYKGCGNGHYYLALDAKTALYYEDD